MIFSKNLRYEILSWYSYFFLNSLYYRYYQSFYPKIYYLYTSNDYVQLRNVEFLCNIPSHHNYKGAFWICGRIIHLETKQYKPPLAFKHIFFVYNTVIL